MISEAKVGFISENGELTFNSEIELNKQTEKEEFNHAAKRMRFMKKLPFSFDFMFKLLLA